VAGRDPEDLVVMACPVSTVKSRIFRAKERLRGLLRDYETK
jgi:DNA-directed RNA polymerase specialized sigma24 family protein